MKSKIINVFVAILFIGFMLTSILSLTSCGDYDHIYIEAIIKNKECVTRHYTQPMWVGKSMIIMNRTSHNYYFDFKDKKEIREEVSASNYNKYEIGDTYIITWRDTEANRTKAKEYFSSNKITYEVDQKKSETTK